MIARCKHCNVAFHRYDAKFYITIICIFSNLWIKLPKSIQLSKIIVASLFILQIAIIV